MSKTDNTTLTGRKQGAGCGGLSYLQLVRGEELSGSELVARPCEPTRCGVVMWEPCSRRCASQAQELVMVHLQQQVQLCAHVRRTDRVCPGSRFRTGKALEYWTLKEPRVKGTFRENWAPAKLPRGPVGGHGLPLPKGHNWDQRVEDTACASCGSLFYKPGQNPHGWQTARYFC